MRYLKTEKSYSLLERCLFFRKVVTYLTSTKENNRAKTPAVLQSAYISYLVLWPSHLASCWYISFRLLFF